MHVRRGSRCARLGAPLSSLSPPPGRRGLLPACLLIIAILPALLGAGLPAHASDTLASAPPATPVRQPLAAPAYQPAVLPVTQALTPVVAATPAAPAPDLTATAALAVDLTANVELYARNADLPLPPASTAKVVTALVVMEMVTRGVVALDEQVRIEADDEVDILVYSNMGLQAGDLVTVRDLLAGILIPSGGDAARALARAMGERLPGDDRDPRRRFADAMNRLAGDLGMRNSHFINPGDDDEPGQVSTARDLAIAGAALFDYPLLERLVAMPVITVWVAGPNPRTIRLESTNKLLGTPGVHGLKTGRSADAGECLILTTWRGDNRVLTVVLGSVERFEDTRMFLAYLDDQFDWVRLGRNGDLPELRTALADHGWALMTSRTVLVSHTRARTMRFRLQPYRVAGSGPWRAGGEVVFYAGTEQLLRLPAYSRPASGPST